MNKPIFQHVRSAKVEALRHALISIFIVFACVYALPLMSVEKHITHIVYVCLTLLVVSVWGIFVIPNLLKKKSRLEFTINNKALMCRLPDGHAYHLSLEEIQSVKHGKLQQSDPGNQYWIETTEGHHHVIPTIYGLSPPQVVKHLRLVRPDLLVEVVAGER